MVSLFIEMCGWLVEVISVWTLRIITLRHNNTEEI